MNGLNYLHEDTGAISYATNLCDLTLRFSATNIRRTSNGKTAAVLTVDAQKDDDTWAMLAYGDMDVDEDEKRVRFRNSIASHIPSATPEDKARLKNALDAFCHGLWVESAGAFMPELVAGCEDPQPSTFVLKPFVVQGGGTIIYAPPKSGKSYLLLLLAVSIDAGLRKLWTVNQQPVLFVNIERSKMNFENRLGAVNRALGLPANRPLHALNRRGATLSEVIPAIQRYCREQHIAVVLVDSISRAGAGDMNKNEVANAITDQLNRVAPTWVALAHTPRGDDQHLYGSVHFEAAADVLVKVTKSQKERGPLGIGLEITGDNDVGYFPQDILHLTFTGGGGVGVLDAARRANRGEFPEIEDKRAMSPADRIANHLASHGPQDASELAGALNMSRTQIVDIFTNNPDRFKRLQKDGRRQPYGLANVSELFPERQRMPA